MAMNSFRLRLIVGGCCVGLAGCTAIGREVSSWFPDKQKEYQYVTEVPALEIPPEMSSSTIEGVEHRRESWESPSEIGRRTDIDEELESEIPPAPRAEMSPESARAYKAGKAHPDALLIQSSTGDPMIEIQAPFEIVWAEVNKALGRMKIEITDQNRSDGLYFVQFGDRPYEDRGFFGDVAEMFSDEAAPSKEYRIKLIEKESVTAIFVLNPEGEPQKTGPGNDLLRELHATLLKTALGSRKDEPAEEPEL